ncbi:hypothetical protein HFN01_32450 [Rhizobium leguminosarum]|uniref:hypothetical protein n=1 Tax=Rhizobium leguminosarum TaxID=384 RepID=UPI001C9470D9|nr:hypothetical protein [Rhizobium leguminosarum]MBY5399513.1 hypothetical protein [Rhizobium leguminosarum]
MIKINPYNLGLLGFRSVGDDAFHWVKAAIKGFDGVSAIEWVATKRLLDEAYSQHDIEDEAIIGRALEQIVGTAKFSEDKHKVSSHVLLEVDIDHFEKEFFANYVAGRSAMPDYSPDPEQFLIEGLADEPRSQESLEGAAPEADTEDEDDDGEHSVLGPSVGTFDPNEFENRRTEDGVTPPLTSPPPTKPTTTRKKKEKASEPITVSDLLRSTRDFLPAHPTETRRTAGRTQTFRSDWDEDEE